MRVQITAKYGYTWRLQYCFKNGPLTENGNSAKKRAGNETAASPANGNGKPEFENGATLLCINQFLKTPKVATFRCASTFLDL